jgi:drug/metabolite transporter (DMT)-like permease
MGVVIVKGPEESEKSLSGKNNPPDETRFLPIAAAAASGILVGSAMVATRFVIDQTAPASLAFLRYLIGFSCLLPPVLLSARMCFERRDLLPICVLGIAHFGILIALLNYGLQFISSSSFLFGKRRLTSLTTTI